MTRGLTNPFRLIRVLWILSRHGGLFALHAFNAPEWVIWFLRLIETKKEGVSPGKRLADALQSLGPTFIKLGQSLAVRGDLIGDEIADELSALQDALPAFSLALPSRWSFCDCCGQSLPAARSVQPWRLHLGG